MLSLMPCSELLQLIFCQRQSNGVPSLSCGDVLEVKHEYIAFYDDGWIDLLFEVSLDEPCLVDAESSSSMLYIT